MQWRVNCFIFASLFSLFSSYFEITVHIVFLLDMLIFIFDNFCFFGVILRLEILVRNSIKACFEYINQNWFVVIVFFNKPKFSFLFHWTFLFPWTLSQWTWPSRESWRICLIEFRKLYCINYVACFAQKGQFYFLWFVIEFELVGAVLALLRMDGYKFVAIGTHLFAPFSLSFYWGFFFFD